MDYHDFIAAKHRRAHRSGIEIDLDRLNSRMHDWQKRAVQWFLKIGKTGAFENCGLGKTIQQLCWSDELVRAINRKALLLCPLAVQWQTLQEAQKFDIQSRVQICKSQDEVKDGITITNYDKLHHFNTSEFDIVVLDESGILKAYTGKTKQMLCNEFLHTPYKLACSATPSPNDRMELGNHADFLSVMPSNEMLARWFTNCGDKVGKYVLKQHGIEDFWRWVASWSLCISMPSDIGGSDEGYALPPLEMHEHIVASAIKDGFLFNVGKSIAATEVHQEKRETLEERADVVASLVNPDSEPWAVWCDTDYEADALRRRIPDAVEVRGSQSVDEKERKLKAFSEGQERVIITKAEIAGFGLNWQHCHKTTWFAGYSFEKFYQAISRLQRFGQTKTVEVHVVRSENEGSICDVVKEKERQHQELQREVSLLMAEGMREELGIGKTLKRYEPTKKIKLPNWLKTKVETS